MDVTEILSRMGLAGATAEPFLSEEDGEAYDVWKVDTGGETLVLKKAKGEELAIYSAFFPGNIREVPNLLGRLSAEEGEYFLMEYIPGEDLCRCTREKLTAALDALIALQERYWGCETAAHVGRSYEKSLPGRKTRGQYLDDPELEAAYGEYLALYARLPRTLCHDDLLPFNVLVSEERAVLIDWEHGGILPYPTSLARLIAHGSGEEAFFFMTEEDKAVAIDYYYERLVKGKGISYEDYRRSLDRFLLYEYCEWIMLGNRYPDADMERFEAYRKKAKTHVMQMG